jgi:hypothetical protein
VPDAVAEACGHPECGARIDEARRAGRRVAVDVLGRRDSALRAYAESLGVARVLECMRKTMSGTERPA